ncbi:MAG: DUF5667 domain-containing protein [Patescibacteria group bacterium]
MKRFSEQFYKKAESIKLRMAEKRELRERLLSYMEYHPLPQKGKVSRSAAVLQSEPYRMIKIPAALLARVAGAAAVITLVVLPFAAEKSVPGDGLYAIKVRFNEEIRSTLALDTYEKVEWETERVNRRIAEARLLASEGRLTEEVEAEMAEAVRTHTKSARKSIEELRTEDADDATLAAVTLDTALEVQAVALKEDQKVEAAALLSIGTDVSEENTTSLLASAVDESLARPEAVGSTSLPAYDKIIARVEQNTTRAYELLNTLSTQADEEEITDVRRRIKDVERNIAGAIELREKDEVQAREKLMASLQRTQKLIVFMTEIEVSETVALESLVPIELTEAETQSQIDSYNKDINKYIEMVEAGLVVETEVEISEKVAVTLERMHELKAQFASTTELEAAKNIAEEVIALGEDAIAVLDFVPEPEVEEEEASDATTSTSTVATSTDATDTETTASTSTSSSTEDSASVGATTTATSTVSTSETSVKTDITPVTPVRPIIPDIRNSI